MTETFEADINVEYVRELRQNYLVIAADQSQEQGYEARMLLGNTIEGLLKFRIKKTDNCSKFCYEITSKQPLSRLLGTRTINAVQIRSLLLGIAQTLIKMEDYLLTEKQILLNPDFIYIEPEEYRPFLCLIPGKRGNFPEEFSSLLQYLLGKTDHQDKDAVVLIYGLYRESLKENYGLDNLLGWLMKEDCPKMDSSGEGESCETINEQEIESWEQSPPEQESKKDTSQRKTRCWHYVPGIVMLIAAAASIILLGMYGWITYGVWLALAGAGLLAVGGGVSFWSSHKELPSQTPYIQNSDIRFSSNQASYSKSSASQNIIPSVKANLLQQVRAQEDPPENSAESGRWQMIFEEEEEPEPFHPPEPPPEPEMNTALLWNGDGIKENRKLVSEDGNTITLPYYPFIIGKQEGLCDYVIPKSTVSRLHLRVDETEDGYQVTDLNSTNGTYVNGRCLDANETAAIEPGDEIGIADLKFRLK